MRSFSKEIDQSLSTLAWSLWTELGIRGVKRNHLHFLISLEELIVLTVTLANFDPRLRDESLDWCAKYHHFISVSRLKTIMKFFPFLEESFSMYSATLNAYAKINWPVYSQSKPLNFTPSHKSLLPPLESPALLNIRSRSIFGTGARADLITFFLTHPKRDFIASELTEIGYTKRNLSEILEELHLGGLFEKFSLRNQQRYRLIENKKLVNVLGPIPDYLPSWTILLEIILTLRDCIYRTENKSESTHVVEIRNLLIRQKELLDRLSLTPPLWQNSLDDYLTNFKVWLLELLRKLSEGDLPDKSYLSSYKK